MSSFICIGYLWAPVPLWLFLGLVAGYSMGCLLAWAGRLEVTTSAAWRSSGSGAVSSLVTCLWFSVAPGAVLHGKPGQRWAPPLRIIPTCLRRTASRWRTFELARESPPSPGSGNLDQPIGFRCMWFSEGALVAICLPLNVL